MFAAYFIFVIASLRSFAPKILLPATIQFAPWEAAFFVVYSFSPPSTWISISDKFSRSCFIFGSVSSINFCAPKPGSTVITNILSMRPSLARSINYAGTGVAGLILTPVEILCYLIFLRNYLRPLY